tara:strand:+ start:184 stop:366 length:183 start_codon:yes stop_codon:yes gene_type:complete
MAKTMQTVFVIHTPEGSNQETTAIVTYDDGTQTYWNKDSDRSVLDTHTKSILDAFFNGIS